MSYKTRQEYEADFKANGFGFHDAKRAAALECIEDRALEARSTQDYAELSSAVLDLIDWLKAKPC